MNQFLFFYRFQGEKKHRMMTESWTLSTASSYPIGFNCPVSDWTVVLGVITVLSWIAIIILIVLLCRLKKTVIKDSENLKQNRRTFRHRPDEEVYGDALSLQDRVYVLKKILQYIRILHQYHFIYFLLNSERRRTR